MVSLYLHLPFCRIRCAYCDFNTYAGLDDLIPGYMRALETEIAQVASGLARSAGGAEPPVVHTVYLGGGTPSVVPLARLRSLLQCVRSRFLVTPQAEVTMEANPGTVDGAYLAGLRELGVNRLSLGVQSADAGELAMLGRLHTFAQAVEAVGDARRAGFENLSLDLIYGLPGQRLTTWERTLEAVLDLRPEHLSLYALTLEPGTPMQARVERGELPAPDDDLAADMYDAAETKLSAAGFDHYEISNWARGGASSLSCRHNLQYWRNLPYLGMGAGAHGFAVGCRYANVRTPVDYIARMAAGDVQPPPASAAVLERTPVDRLSEERDTVLLGLRLLDEGVGFDSFEARFGRPLLEAFGTEIEALSGQGLLDRLPDRVRLAPRAHLLANQVFLHFV